MVKIYRTTLSEVKKLIKEQKKRLFYVLVTPQNDEASDDEIMDMLTGDTIADFLANEGFFVNGAGRKRK
jgi:hypothetical protein